MSEQVKEMTDEQKIKDWEVLFPNPIEALYYKSVAVELAKAGIGKRKIKSGLESDAAFLMRIQHCLTHDIPVCMLNQTYIVDGVVSEMEDLKEGRFAKMYPEGRIEPVMWTETTATFRMQLRPGDPWFVKKLTAKDVTDLGYVKSYKKHYKSNMMGMLSIRVKTILIDGVCITGSSGYMSHEELIEQGIKILEAEGNE